MDVSQEGEGGSGAGSVLGKVKTRYSGLVRNRFRVNERLPIIHALSCYVTLVIFEARVKAN